MGKSVRAQRGRRDERKSRRGLSWLAAVLFIASGVLLVCAVLLVVPALVGREFQTNASAPGVTGAKSDVIANQEANGAGQAVTQPSSFATTLSTVELPTTSSSTVTSPLAHPIIDPAKIVIPAIGVNAKLVPVGLLESGEMETPRFGLAGWYKLGPVPGATGPAVIVAHVDTKKGPDVFFRLHELVPGDKVEVYGADGDKAVFVVESQETVLKSALPTDRIWNQTDQALLRLITCGGQFDPVSGHYLSNTIIYAHLEGS